MVFVLKIERNINSPVVVSLQLMNLTNTKGHALLGSVSRCAMLSRVEPVARVVLY